MFGVVALAIAGFVTVATLIVLNILDRAIRRYEQQYLKEGARSLDEMFIFIDSRQLMLLAVIGASVLMLLGWVLFNWFMGLLLLVVGFMSPRMVIRHMQRKRLDKFERQLVDTLNQLSSAFRAGLTFPQAAENVASEVDAPLGDEFKLLVREIKIGVSLEEALQNMADRVKSESLQLTVTATNISRQLGGNIAEMYDIIAETVRARFEIEGRIKALTSMGRMQAWVVGSMPLVVGVVLNFMRPDLMEPMLASNFGKGLIVTVILMEIVGVWMMRRIVDIEV